MYFFNNDLERTNHDMVCKIQDVVSTNHAVVYKMHTIVNLKYIRCSGCLYTSVFQLYILGKGGVGSM